jgi:pimeloyl-ACP methyl ester carboxylesterase
VALEAALRAPEAFRSVVAIAPYLPWRRFRGLLQGAHLLDPRAAEWLPLEQAWPVLRWLAALLESTPFVRDDQVAQAGVRFIYYAACPATRSAFVSAAREMALDPAFGDDGFWTRLASLAVPATFVWGERDQLISPRFAGPIARILPRARQILMPCVGHWWNGPHHRCLAQTLADLLDDLAAPPAPQSEPSSRASLPTRPCLVGDAADASTPWLVREEDRGT